MALDGNAMGDAVVTALQGLNPDIVPADLKPFWEAICTAIVNHIKSDGVVNPGSFNVSSAPGPVSGAGTIS